MADELGGSRLVTAGRVGRPHGLDGSFKVSDPQHPLGSGTRLTVAGTPHRVCGRRGTAERPIVTLEGVADREAAGALAGELLLVAETESPLKADEWLASDLVGCAVAGLGPVRRVLDGPSCDVLELEDGSLVPLVADALLDVDLEAGVITVDRGFLGLDAGA